MVTKEQILDRISMLLIENFSHPNMSQNSISEWQQAIISGSIVYNTDSQSDEIVMYGSDEVANGPSDSATINFIHSYMKQNNLGIETLEFNPGTLHFTINGTSINAINPEYNSVVLINNFSQYIDFTETYKKIDNTKAQEVLDTEIFELLPTALSRQQQINNFFSEYQILKGDIPPYEIDSDNNDELDTMEPGTAAEYSGSHDISSLQNQGENTSEAFITRLDKDANTINTGKTLQSLRDDLNNFLKDVDADPSITPEDNRPDYDNQSGGYLKIRHLNQGMIIRKQEGDDIGIERLVKHPQEGYYAPSYLVKGFTITMWVKFLDRVNSGTLFNYGNPMRVKDPKGFRLETFVINKDDELETQPGTSWGEIAPPDFFKDNDFERFIRLIVRDDTVKDDDYPKGRIFDSHRGIPQFPYSKFVPELGFDGTEVYKRGDERYLLSHIRVPIDFNEWFFINASYDPTTNDMATSGVFEETIDYWNGNIDPIESQAAGENVYSHNSGYGTKCKVEIISKSELLRARGYKPEED